jgi:shikimate dehydrogenase
MLTRSTATFAGVLGWPLERTLSPAIHNAALRSMGIDCTYLAWAVAPALLESAVHGLRALDALGANVTMPYKDSVIPMLDELHDEARVVGAVNTIAVERGLLIGYNTDVSGFAEMLTADAGVDPSGSRALVLGAGGAARAVTRALLDLGASSVVVAARNPKAAAWTRDAGLESGLYPWARAAAGAREADIIVNCTPLGSNREAVLEAGVVRGGQTVVDLIYDPPSTPLLEGAREVGAAAWNGLGMLLHQAAESLRIWTKQDPPMEVMSVAAVRALGLR